MLTSSRALPRRMIIAVTGLALAASSLTALSTPASAASTTTVTVTGTSDVYDSGLIQAVIAPGFQKAYPQYKLNYISEGTGKAIQDAEGGVSSALIVHAPSLENAFVAGNASGVSYSAEPAGRAIFWGDYILAGGTADPAGVDPGAPDTYAHDIVAAFEKVATEGSTLDGSGNPGANFVSRGGTPGTTVQEHAIWALATTVPTCMVSSASGGGAVPVDSTSSYVNQPCPSSVPYPSWYHVTGLTQGPNITNANACNYPGGENQSSGVGNNCYVFTDRGTFNFLQSGSASQAGKLSLFVRDNDASAPGGSTLLVNTFHAYAVNPDAVPNGSNVNVAGAKAFLDYLTSAKGQTAIGQYLDSSNDPPFIPDAQPAVSVAGRPNSVTGSTPVTITGSLRNVVPGTPALSGVTVKLLGQPSVPSGAAYADVASAQTDNNGDFSLTFTPYENANYEVTTPALGQQLEYSETPGPNFYDALQATSTTLGAITVKPLVQNVTAKGSNKSVKISGRITPARHVTTSHISLYARPAGSTAAFKYYGRAYLKTGNAFTATFAIPNGKYSYYLSYVNTGYVSNARSATQTVTVG